MGKKPPKWLPGERVNETILTQRKSVEQLRADRLLRKDKLKDQRSRMKAKIDAKRKKRLTTKKFVPAQAILNSAVRQTKLARGFWKRGEKFSSRLSRKERPKVEQQYKNAPIALVVRTAGKQVPREVTSALLKMGLKKMYQARLIHLNPANDRLTKMLKSFTTVGFPTVAQTEALIRTRGSFWNPETKSKTYISGNLQVEQTLGQFNVLSIEELTDAVTTKSEHIDDILRFLAPFDLHPPRPLKIEKQRSAHEKLEIANPDAFTAYLESQLEQTAREKSRVKKVIRAKSSQPLVSSAAASAKKSTVKKAAKKALVGPAKSVAA